MHRNRFERIAVLVFDRAPLFETAVPLSVFGIDRTSTGAPRFTVDLVAGDRGVLTSTAGMRMEAPRGLAALRRADVVIVPTWRDPHEPPPPDVLAALTAAHRRGATVVGLCLGAFVLAAAGLLDGRRAATHWMYAPLLAERHPTVTVDSSVLFVDEGDVLTSAGTAAGIDACLHLVRTAWGARAATAIARRMVVAPQRAGGQAQYIEAVLPSGDGALLGSILADALQHLDGPLEVNDLAGRAAMSRRSFDRRFRQVTGTSPQQWWLHQRVLRAQRLLEETDLGVEAIAREVGFGTAVSLRPHFRRIVGISPRAYRDRFR